MSAANHPDDRRTHPRVPLKADTEVFKLGAAFHARVSDVSMGGARIFVGEPVGEWGDAVDLRLPTPSRVVVRGTIVRTQREGDGYLLGLRFDPLSPAEKESLASLVGG